MSLSIGKIKKCIICNEELRTTDNIQENKIYCSRRCNYLGNYHLVVIHNIRKNMFRPKIIAKELGLVKFGWYLAT